MKLIVEREREIQKFQSEPFFRVNAIFDVAGGSQVKAELDHRFKTYDEAHAFLESCKDAAFTVGDITKKPLKRMPAPPFTTSTLQQEAARKLGFTVSQTMMIAQRLYESGRITYMRTDSVHLSSFALNACKDEIMKDYGEEYIHNREFQTKSKGAGGPRGHTPHVRQYRQGRVDIAGAPPLRPHLEAHHSLTDG